MENAKLTISLVLMMILVIFIIQNTAVMEVRFLFWTVAMSRALMLFLLVGVGIVCGWFLHGYLTHRKSR
jgi:uncharacterized integral membrane protein